MSDKKGDGEIEILKMSKIFIVGKITYETFIASFQGWEAYVRWADAHNQTKNMIANVTSYISLYHKMF